MKEHTQMGKVFKARYFTSCSFSREKANHNPNYVWRSMLGAKFLVEEGFKWKVGNRRKINTWQGKWLPTNSGSKVVSVWEVVDQNAIVEDLIDYEIKQCKRNIIFTNFNKFEAK